MNEKDITGLNVVKCPDDIDGLTKPTYYKLNEFTAIFQEIVDTYGVPSYKEVNPAIFTCVSFPFFFGMMFGDLMHGSILTAFGIFLCFSKQEPGTVGATFGKVRYLFLLMGFFAFFNGAIYNDYTSMGTEMFGKGCYSTDDEKVIAGKEIQNVKNQAGTYYAEKTDAECMYPFGIDPIWFRSSNEIAIMNSFKMKISVIFGVAQMLLGTLMKGFNAVYFKEYVELAFEVVTQALLLIVLFGFMDYMIISKWLTNWDDASLNSF